MGGVSCRRLRVFKSFLIKNALNAGRPVRSVSKTLEESGEANAGSAYVPLIIHSLSFGHFFLFFILLAFSPFYFLSLAPPSQQASSRPSKK